MRLTLRDIQTMKTSGERIAVLTAYDATSAFLAEAAGLPVLLVGDSLGMVVQGHDSTLPVTLDQMVYHCQMVVRATKRALIVGDLPFMTYATPEQALHSAGRLMQESGVSAVKLEGGAFMAPTIARLVQYGIPVMAHIGLTPQSVNQFGGFRVQGKDHATALQLLRDARAVQEAGAFAVVLELVPTLLAAEVTRRLSIPTIGIGAGVECSGQVQVFHDVLNLHPSFGPRHAKRYADIGPTVQDALSRYAEEVRCGEFPTAAHSSKMDPDLIASLRAQEV